MKLKALILGVGIGLIAGFSLGYLLQFRNNAAHTISNKTHQQALPAWQWPDSLDATKAASQNHRIVFENDKVRILEVVLRPHEYERMHTHRLPSVMFGGGDAAAPPFDIIYYRYRYDTVTHRYVVKDSTRQHNAGSKAGTPDSGYFMKPEGPHAIKNLSNVTVDVYRVELKNGK